MSKNARKSSSTPKRGPAPNARANFARVSGPGLGSLVLVSDQPANRKPSPHLRTKGKAAPAPKREPAVGQLIALPAMPGHHTASGTQKHQCAGPIAWGAIFLAAAQAEYGPDAKQGQGVHLALAIGVAALAERLGRKA